VTRMIICLACVMAVATSNLAMAQPSETVDFKTVEGGHFKLDKRHARIVFSTTHLGFSTYYGFFGDIDGKLDYDPASPTASTLETSVNLNVLVTNDSELDENLKSPDYFDVPKFPVATFKSTKIEITGAATGKITGDLTLHGVTKPVVLDVTLNRGGTNPVTQSYILGFDATGTLSRSEFGIKTLVPFVGDQVKLVLSCEFNRVK
jgi:polyisoprenoid-binding protein YceI